jgi:hypothetical protein
MIQNTVQTLIDYAKDLSGQTNAPTAKILRALNFGKDHLSVIKLMVGSKSNPDSSNQTDLSRVTVTTSDTTLSISGGDLENNEALTFRHLEIATGSTYTRLIPIDSRDSQYEYLQNQTGEPTHFDLDGNIIRLLPTPGGSYTYRLSYGRVHPGFSIDALTASTGLLPNEEEYVALYAADRLMIGMSDTDRTAVRNELTIKADEIKKMTALRDQSTSKRLKPKASTFSRNQFTQNKYTI